MNTLTPAPISKVNVQNVIVMRLIAGLVFVIAVLCCSTICLSQTQGGTVVGWDSDGNWLTNVPAGADHVVFLAANSYYAVGVKVDGSVSAWGQYYDDFMSVPPGVNGVSAVAAGPNHTLGLKNDGTVIAWGDRYNSYGVQDVPAGLSNVVAVFATVYDSFALKSDGTVTAWGDNMYGSRNIPDGVSNIVAIAARDYSGICLKCDGTVFSWGLVLETNMPTGLTNIVAIADANNNAMALRSDGTVISWANDVPAAATNVIDIVAAGENLALNKDGKLVRWGSGSVVPSAVSNVVGMAANLSGFFAVTNDGTPVIFRQPFAQQTVFSGTRVLLNVGAIGQPYPDFQWQKNGTNEPNATNATLILENVQLSDAANYTVAISNTFGVFTSRTAALAVVDAAPSVTAQPVSKTYAVGVDATLSVSATGSLPLNYQWRFNGTNIDGATNGALTLTNIQTAGAGNYDVVIANAFGWTNSSNAVITVMDFAAALNTTNVLWETGGSVPWFVTTATSRDGASVRTGNVGYNQNSILQTTVTGPATLNFWWYLDFNSVPINYSFYLNGTAQSTSSGGWQNQTYYLPAGSNLLQWVYLDSFNGVSTDFGLLDQVSISGGGTAPIIKSLTGNQTKPAGTNATFAVTAVGTPSLNYQWYFNSNMIAGATNATLILTNVQASDAGIYMAQVSNDFGITNSTNSSLTVTASAPYFIKQPTNQFSLPGGNVTFSLQPGGSAPLSYQWYFGSTPVTDATNSVLILNNVQATNGGRYSVQVTNAYGTASSTNFTLTVSTVVGWNSSLYGQATTPSALGTATAIAGSQYNSVALLTDGSLFAWGRGNSGSTNIPAGLTNVVAVSLTDGLGLALRNDGTVGWWGTASAAQTNPIPFLSNIISVTACPGNGFALQSNGTVVAWGSNTSHQTNLPAGLSNVVAVAAGTYHDLALKNDGTVVSWGNSGSPTNIPPFVSNIVAIAAGYNYGLAAKDDGTVVAWPTNEANVAMRIPPGLSNVVSVAGEYTHAMALTSDGTVWEWGSVGTGYLSNRFSFSNAIAVAIACGDYHSLANLGGGAPQIIRQPWPQTFYAGYATTLSAGVVAMPPVSYQWQQNGTNLDGATNAILNFPLLRPEHNGTYVLVASNALGTTVSSNVILSVITNAPLLALQLTNQVIYSGSNVTFSVAVSTGPIPNTFQWQFNGTNIVGATNTSLTLTNIQTTNQGTYSVIVDNGYGTTTSSNASLFVLDMATALNSTDLAWTTSGNALWFPQTNTTYDGYEAAQSGSISYGQSSKLQTTVTGPGTLAFRWMFSPTNISYNSLSFSSTVANVSATVTSTSGWQQRTFYLGSGQQTLTWTYTRSGGYPGVSTGWVDQVSFVPGATLPTVTSMSPDTYVRANTNVALVAAVYGSAPMSYQWQLNGTNLPNKTIPALTFIGVQPASSGLYTLVVTNPFGSVSTNVNLWVGQFNLSSNPTNSFLSQNGFRLKLDGVLTTNPVIIYGSTDLVSWLPLFTNPATTGSVQFLDFDATNTPARFYRAQE